MFIPISDKTKNTLKFVKTITYGIRSKNQKNQRK